MPQKNRSRVALAGARMAAPQAQAGQLAVQEGQVAVQNVAPLDPQVQVSPAVAQAQVDPQGQVSPAVAQAQVAVQGMAAEPPGQPGLGAAVHQAGLVVDPVVNQAGPVPAQGQNLPPDAGSGRFTGGSSSGRTGGC